MPSAPRKSNRSASKQSNNSFISNPSTRTSVTAPKAKRAKTAPVNILQDSESENEPDAVASNSSNSIVENKSVEEGDLILTNSQADLLSDPEIISSQFLDTNYDANSESGDRAGLLQIERILNDIKNTQEFKTETTDESNPQFNSQLSQQKLLEINDLVQKYLNPMGYGSDECSAQIEKTLTALESNLPHDEIITSLNELSQFILIQTSFQCPKIELVSQLTEALYMLFLNIENPELQICIINLFNSLIENDIYQSHMLDMVNYVFENFTLFQNLDLGEALLKFMTSGFDDFENVLIRSTIIAKLTSMLDFYQSFAQNQLLKLFERIISCPDVKKLDQLIFVPKMVELLDVPELSKSTKETCIEIVMGFFEMLNANFVDSNNGFVTNVILSILIKLTSIDFELTQILMILDGVKKILGVHRQLPKMLTDSEQMSIFLSKTNKLTERERNHSAEIRIAVLELLSKFVPQISHIQAVENPEKFFTSLRKIPKWKFKHLKSRHCQSFTKFDNLVLETLVQFQCTQLTIDIDEFEEFFIDIESMKMINNSSKEIFEVKRSKSFKEKIEANENYKDFLDCLINLLKMTDDGKTVGKVTPFLCFCILSMCKNRLEEFRPRIQSLLESLLLHNSAQFLVTGMLVILSLGSSPEIQSKVLAKSKIFPVLQMDSNKNDDFKIKFKNYSDKDVYFIIIKKVFLRAFSKFESPEKCVNDTSQRFTIKQSNWREIIQNIATKGLPIDTAQSLIKFNEFGESFANDNVTIHDLMSNNLLSAFSKVFQKLKSKNQLDDFVTCLKNIDQTQNSPSSQPSNAFIKLVSLFSQLVDFHYPTLEPLYKRLYLPNVSFENVISLLVNINKFHSIPVKLEPSKIVNNSLLPQSMRAPVSIKLDLGYTVGKIAKNLSSFWTKSVTSENILSMNSSRIEVKIFLNGELLHPQHHLIHVAFNNFVRSYDFADKEISSKELIKCFIATPLKLTYAPNAAMKRSKENQFICPIFANFGRISPKESFKMRETQSKSDIRTHLNICHKILIDHITSSNMHLEDQIKDALVLKKFSRLEMSIINTVLFFFSGHIPPQVFDSVLKNVSNIPRESRKLLFQTITENISIHIKKSLNELFGPVSTRLQASNFTKTVKINRESIMKSVIDIYNKMGSKIAYDSLEIQFEDEIGTGLGPTLEFYSILCDEFKQDEELWVKNSSQMLHPALNSENKKVEQSIRTKFECIGYWVAKAIVDNRNIDLPLSIPFIKSIIGYSANFDDFDFIDSETYKSLKRIENMDNIEELEIYFVDPKTQKPLIPQGENILISKSNIRNYLKKITELYFQNGIEYAVISFITGFSKICSIDALKLLFADEIYKILHQTDLRSMLTEAEIVENVLFKGDFTADSKAIKYFCKYAASLTDERQKKLVKWLTGSTRLASGGFKSMQPKFTIMKKDRSKPDEVLPSVMTCMNYLKLPDYSTYKILEEKFNLALDYCPHSFHLS